MTSKQINKLRTYRNFKDYHIEKLRDPEEAIMYLNIALEDYGEDSDIEEFLVALRDVAAAHGGLTKLAEKTYLNRSNLYRLLSKNGNPQIKTLEVILNQLGLQLTVAPRTTALAA